MRMFSRFSACLVVLFLAVVTIGDARAVCGVPNMVSVGINPVTGAITGTVMLYSASPPYLMDGWGLMVLGAPLGDAMFDLSVAAATATPPYYMRINSPLAACDGLPGDGCDAAAMAACGFLTLAIIGN